ncbi:MAG TPA: hypothetical protein VJX70_04730 [Candidatus Acidoferrum sp.]|nr:hypothetical protein [Candidatus Acidoferrum sp.]
MPIRVKHRGQDGYALTLVVFLLALVVIASVAAAPDILTNGRREKEEEMIWRGKQYVRGIRLFVRYNQMHGGVTKFPTSMEDLTKNKVGIRFMRQEYKDPLNSVDGSWRLIYVGPNGQLIGSLKDHPLLPNGQTAGTSVGNSSGFSSPLNGGSQSSFGSGSSGNSSFGNSSFGSGSSSNSSFGSSSSGSSMGAGANSQGGDSSLNAMSTPQPIGGSDASAQIIGGNIIGVGSKVNKKSIIWYDKAKNYRQFEFVWDPSKEPVNGGASAGSLGIPPTNTQNGSNSIFSTPAGNGGFGQSSPGTGTTNSNPNPGSGQNPPPGQMPPGQNP